MIESIVFWVLAALSALIVASSLWEFAVTYAERSMRLDTEAADWSTLTDREKRDAREARAYGRLLAVRRASDLDERAWHSYRARLARLDAGHVHPNRHRIARRMARAAAARQLAG